LFDALRASWRDYCSIGLPIATLFVFGFQCEFRRVTGHRSPPTSGADLHYGLSAILIFVGAKMPLAAFYKIAVASP